MFRVTLYTNICLLLYNAGVMCQVHEEYGVAIEHFKHFNPNDVLNRTKRASGSASIQEGAVPSKTTFRTLAPRVNDLSATAVPVVRGAGIPVPSIVYSPAEYEIMGRQILSGCCPWALEAYETSHKEDCHFTTKNLDWHLCKEKSRVCTEWTGPQLQQRDKMTDEQRLIHCLFDHYNKAVRPVLNSHDMVTVGMGMTITQIFDMNEKDQVLIVNAWQDLEWFDEFMTWLPGEFGGLHMIRIPADLLWIPDIILYNSAADYTNNAYMARAMVRNDGYVFWGVPTKLYTSCKIVVTFFPFDEQTCHMKFGSWSYDGFKVDLTNRTDRVDISNYVKNGEWDLKSIKQKRNVKLYTCCEEPYPDITFYIYIHRKTLYYMYNVFFPCICMSSLTLLVFLLPPDSGEKVALGITILLAFSVFMLSVVQSLPETSQFVPLISIYLTVVMSMTALSIMMTVFVLNLHHRSPQTKPLPDAFQEKVLNPIGSFCCLPKETADKSGTTVKLSYAEFASELQTELGGTIPTRPSEGMLDLAAALERIMERHAEDDRLDGIVNQWRRLALLVDRLLFWLFFITTAFFTIFILLFAPVLRIR